MKCIVRNCRNRPYERLVGISFHRKSRRKMLFIVLFMNVIFHLLAIVPLSSGSVEERFEFPTNSKEKAVWMNAIGDVDTNPSQYACVCSNHFRKADLIKLARKSILVTGAVPSQNLNLEPTRKDDCSDISNNALPISVGGEYVSSKDMISSNLSYELRRCNKFVDIATEDSNSDSDMIMFQKVSGMPANSMPLLSAVEMYDSSSVMVVQRNIHCTATESMEVSAAANQIVNSAKIDKSKAIKITSQNCSFVEEDAIATTCKKWPYVESMYINEYMDNTSSRKVVPHNDVDDAFMGNLTIGVDENISHDTKNNSTKKTGMEAFSVPIVKDVRLNNSHHHDSEYDTASDDSDYDDESLGADGEEDESENGSVGGFDLERQRGDGQEQDFAKKVDEDRSNPQYIPKKGNFYEHDDRTLDEPGDNENKVADAEGDQTKSSTPNNSLASKTMKKWQPASAVDRWSHDRYEENEQAPKSRQELVSAYGYDIRSEDGPPRPRRRRRYGRGPNKYIRNWEDESAYIKSNTSLQRKPRPEDFPALGDRERRSQKSQSFREEKENRYDRDSERTSTTFNRGTNISQRDDRIDKRNSGKSFRAGGRQSLEFRNQNRNRLSDAQLPPQSTSSSSFGRKIEKDDTSKYEMARTQGDFPANFSMNKPGRGPKIQNEKSNSTPHENKKFNPIQNTNNNDNIEKISAMNSTMGVVATNRQQPVTPTLASRLQVQNRNDPSHVGSIQMHSIMTQSQQEQQQQQQQQQASEANRTKRYSSLRQRAQNDTTPTGPQPTIVDQHTLAQQIQMHDHHQSHAPQLQDQHLLQANIMQLYHTQENLQAQIQGVTLQGLAGSHQQKPQYQNVQAQYQATAPAPAFYAPAAEYPQATPQAVAYIQPQPSATQMATYTPQPQANGTAPAGLSYVQSQGPAGPAGYQNYPGYQNYNTVGGTTYFVPQQQTAARPVVLPQRRPTNAIPILAPPNDKHNKSTRLDNEDDIIGKSSHSFAPLGSAENIDHILDNMFVQRPPLQPPTRKSSSPSTEIAGIAAINTINDEKIMAIQVPPQQSMSSTSTEILFLGDTSRLEEGVKTMTLTDDSKPLEQQPQSQPSHQQAIMNSSVSNTPIAAQEQITPTANETG